MKYKLSFFIVVIVIASISFGLASAKKNVHTWNIGETTSKFTITIPKNYSAKLLEVKNGQFQSMLIKGPKNAEGKQTEINIRTGYFPTYRHDEMHFDTYHSGKRMLRFLNLDIECLSYEYDKRTLLIEQILSMENVKPGLKVDFNLIAYDKKDMEVLIKILETLQLEGANPNPVPQVVVIDAQTKGLFTPEKRIYKYGTFIRKDKIITGSQYYHNDDGSLLKIELYKDGIYIRDSIIVK